MEILFQRGVCDGAIPFTTASNMPVSFGIWILMPFGVVYCFAHVSVLLGVDIVRVVPEIV